MLCVADDRLKCADAAARHAGSARCLSAAVARPRFCGLSVLHVSLHLLDVCDRQLLDDPPAKQRDDVCPDPALVHFERRGFDRKVLSAKDIPGSGLGQIPIAHLGDSHPFAGLAHFVRRIFTSDDLGKLHNRLPSRLLDGQRAEPAKIETALDCIDGAILNHERLQTGR